MCPEIRQFKIGQNSLDESDAHMLWEAEWNEAVEFY